MNPLTELEFEQEKQRLLTTYKCKTLDEVIEYLKNQIMLKNEKKTKKKVTT
jgi:hypothetical protein